MEFPFFFASVNESEMKKFGEKFQTIFDKSFWSFSDLVSDLFGYLVEMVELVSNDSDKISH